MVVEREEIILMTKLALHEKKHGKQDKKRSSYFKWDYIYMNNWYTRLAVAVAFAIVISWMVLTDVYIKEIVPVFDVDLWEYLSKYVVYLILLLVAYTGLSTMVFNKKYEQTQKRLQEYEALMKELDRYQHFKELREGELHDAIQ